MATKVSNDRMQEGHSPTPFAAHSNEPNEPQTHREAHNHFPSESLIPANVKMQLTSFMWHLVLLAMIVLPCVGYSQLRLNAIDGQCPREYYFQSSSCVSCSPCSERDWPPNYRSECKSYPNLCINSGDQKLTWQLMNFPSILGPYSTDQNLSYLVFFFQEGDKATIGKLCLEEAEHHQSEWNSYQKTRLLCNGSDGEQFNTLEAVRVHAFTNNIKPMYFVLMSSDRNKEKKSVLCAVELNDLKKTFRSREFLDPITGTIKTDLPEPPYYASGFCNFENFSIWLRDYPLMWTPVDCTEKSFESTGRFITLETLEKRGLDLNYHKIVFVGTDDGRLLKFSWDGNSFNYLMEMYVTNSSSIGISSLDVIWRNDVRILSLNTSDGVTHIEELQRCKDISSKCVCEQDPFCHWSTIRVECLEFTYSGREEEDSQPIIKKQCGGVGENEPLLIVDEFGRSHPEVPVMTVTASHHVTEEITNQPESTESHLSPEKVGTNVGMLPWYILPLIGGLFVAFLLIAVCITIQKQCYRDPQDTADFRCEIGYTKITVTYRSGDRNITLLDDFDRELYPTVIKEKGKVCYCVRRRGIVTFENLCPLTSYRICFSDRQKIVETKGLFFQNSMVDKNTYRVNITTSETLPEAFIVLESSDKRYKKETAIRGHSFRLSSLPSNMKFTVNVEYVSNSWRNAKKRISQKIDEIETSAENFTVTQKNEEPCLEWHDLPQWESHLRLSSCECCDFENWAEDEPSVNGSKEIPSLPAGIDCHLVIKSTFNDGHFSFEHIIAEVDYSTPDFDVPGSDKCLDAIINLPPDRRLDVANQMFLYKTSVKVLLELFKSDESCVTYYTSDTILQCPADVEKILVDLNEQLTHLQLSKFLLNLQQLLISETSNGWNQGNRSNSERLFNVVRTVVEGVHEDGECSSCNQVLLKCRHHVHSIQQ